MITSNALRFHHSCIYLFDSKTEAALGARGGCVWVFDSELRLLLSQGPGAVRFPLGGGVCLLYSLVSRASELNFPEAG